MHIADDVAGNPSPKRSRSLRLLLGLAFGLLLSRQTLADPSDVNPVAQPQFSGPIVLPEIAPIRGIAPDGEITIDQVGECMGMRSQSGTMYSDLQARRVDIDARSTQLKDEGSAFEAAKAVMEAEGRQLETRHDQLNAISGALEKRIAALNRTRPTSATPAEAKAFNDKVASYNADGASLMRDQVAFNQQVKTHNQQLQVLNDQGQALNLKVADLKTKTDPFNVDVAHLADLSTRYTQQCVGAKKLVK